MSLTGAPGSRFLLANHGLAQVRHPARGTRHNLLWRLDVPTHMRNHGLVNFARLGGADRKLRIFQCHPAQCAATTKPESCNNGTEE
jgi:hypothetical protein